MLGKGDPGEFLLGVQFPKRPEVVAARRNRVLFVGQAPGSSGFPAAKGDLQAVARQHLDAGDPVPFVETGFFLVRTFQPEDIRFVFAADPIPGRSHQGDLGTVARFAPDVDKDCFVVPALKVKEGEFIPLPSGFFFGNKHHVPQKQIVLFHWL